MDALANIPEVILMVEDEPLVRLAGADILADHGYTVLEAADADEAMSLLQSGEPISLLFTDVNMPGEMDGLDLAFAVSQRWPHIRQLITSGRPLNRFRPMPSAAHFLQKPYDMDEVLAEVRELSAMTPYYDLGAMQMASWPQWRL